MAYKPAFDIGRIRQQSVMAGIPELPDYMNGDYGMGNDNRMQSPFDQVGQSTGPTFPTQESQAPVVPGVTSYEPPQPPPDPESLSSRKGLDLIGLVNQQYTPETTSRDRFNKLLDEMPERNQPGWARKLVAGGISLGANDPVKTAEDVMYAPYNRDMDTFKAKSTPFQQAAQLENTANINERQLTGNLVTATVNANRYDMQNEAATERNRINRIKATMGPGWSMNARGPTVIKQNRATGEVIDTGIKTGWMTEADKVEAEGKWDVKAAEARGAATGWNTYQYPDGSTVRWNENTGQKLFYPPGSATPSPMSGAPEGPMNTIGTPRTTATNTLETNRQAQQRMMELYQTDQNAKKYISNANGTFTMKPRPVVQPDTWWPGNQEVTQDEVDAYDAYRKEIYPNYTPPTTTATPNPGSIGPSKVPAAPSAPPKQAPTAGTGRGTGYDPNQKVLEYQEDRDKAAAAKVSTVPDSQGRMIQLPPPLQNGIQPILQEKAGKFRISYDGGKTFRPFTPTYVGK